MTGAPTKLPVPKAVRDTLSDLVGRRVEVSSHVPVSVANTDSVAVYIDETRLARAAIVADLAMAVHAGSALGLIPPAAAKKAVESRSLPENARENFDEVLNILAGLLNAPGTVHVKLDAVFGPGDPVPADVRAAAAALGRRLDLTIEIPGYGSGVLSFVLM